MGMPDTARRYTVEEVLAFPNDGNRYELVHGELLVSPVPRVWHQVVAGRLHVRLSLYLDGHKNLALVLFSPADITWGTEERIMWKVAPDAPEMGIELEELFAGAPGLSPRCRPKLGPIPEVAPAVAPRAAWREGAR